MPLAQDLNPEITSLKKWIGPLVEKSQRSPLQINALNESDCELIKLGGHGSEQILALTIDSVSEEIDWGLYRDPYTMGWVAATASLSDLAAVAAKPLGLLWSTLWRPDDSTAFKEKIAMGFYDAIKAENTSLLGGDSGHSSTLILSSVGVGICETGKTLTRMNIKAGDWILHSGSIGIGSALAMRFLRGEPEEDFPESLYRPRAQIELAQKLKGVAHAAIDTSDGLLSSFDTLCRLNGCEMELHFDPNHLNSHARMYCEERRLPLSLLWWAEHGDFQLLLAVTPENLQKALKIEPSLHILAQVTERSESKSSAWITQNSTRTAFDLSQARNLLHSLSENTQTLRGAVSTLADYARSHSWP